MVALLTDGFDRADPVVERLFPDVYPDDPASTADLRQYIDGDLKTAKIDQAGAILAALPAAGGTEVSLDDEAAEAWLRALNDVRLALGIRLEVRDDMDIEEELDEAVLRDPTSPRVGQLELYGYLGLRELTGLNSPGRRVHGGRPAARPAYDPPHRVSSARSRRAS